MKNVTKKVLKAIQEYQVPGSTNEFDEENFEQKGLGVEWSDHCPGTFIMGIGRVFLGMPKGFNRMGPDYRDYNNDLRINIFESYDHFLKTFMRGEKIAYDKFNVPCWKYVNKKGHTFVRGLSPRINYPFLHIILEDCRDKINCLEITEEDLNHMD